MNTISSPAAGRQYHSGLDVLKFILSVMVVAIHTELWPRWVFPWARVAVPLFFMISAYLFFGKLRQIPDAAERRKALLQFVKRNLCLYGFWFVCLLPFTLVLRNYFADGLAAGLLALLKGFFFGSTFRASWYIMATIIGTVMVYFLSERLGAVWALILSALVYLPVCLGSGYGFALTEGGPVAAVTGWYQGNLANPANSFPVSMLWICLGKWAAEHPREGSLRGLQGIAAAGFAALLWLEWRLVEHFGGSISCDCYFALIPLCLSLFYIALRLPLQLKSGSWLRKISTITYAMHATFASGLSFVCSLMGLEPARWLRFLITLAVSWTLSIAIVLLSRKKAFRFLKYAC